METQEKLLAEPQTNQNEEPLLSFFENLFLRKVFDGSDNDLNLLCLAEMFAPVGG